MGTPSKDVLMKSSFVLTRAALTPSANVRALVSPVKTAITPRKTLRPKSPAAKLNTKLAKSSPISAPAGRSPSHGKRSGILSNRRRTTGPFSHIDSATSPESSAAPFSLDAALKGTIPSYSSRARSNAVSRGSTPSLGDADVKASWFFDIHEDSPEQEMTNLLQHGTCVLDISSDEEAEQKRTRDDTDKENVPPMDDVSQTARRAARVGVDDMVVEKERIALGEMNTADYFADGCDETSVILVPADEEAESKATSKFDFEPRLRNVESTWDSKSIDELIANASPSKASVLQHIEGSGETFDLWESGSAKDESEKEVSAVVL